MIRFFLIFVMSLAVSSQALAVKWNNSGGDSIQTYTNKYGEVYDYGSNFEMPERPSPKPNQATLLTYLEKYLNRVLRERKPKRLNRFRVIGKSIIAA